MYNFKNDYSEGAHSRILDKLIETNLIQQAGYGEDEYAKAAKSILKKKIANEQAVVYFFIWRNTDQSTCAILSLTYP